MEEAYFVPENIPADVLFRNMKKEKQQFAVVLDEYGGVSGILTISDLVEQLVGDLVSDTENTEDEMIRKIDDNSWMVDGCVSLEILSETIGVDLESEFFDTLNGLVFTVLETVPEINDEISLEKQSVLIKVLAVENRQVKTAKITKNI